LIRWFAVNGIAANFLMLAILLGGVYSAFYRVPLEVSPSLSLNSVRVEMNYLGGTAKDVERAILVPIEEALEGVSGIKQLRAFGSRGSGRMMIEAESGADLQVLMDEVSARIDTITTFPDETERPRVSIPDSGMWFEVLNVAVTGEMDPYDLLRVTRRVHEDILELPGISLANIDDVRRFEISVEADAEQLIAYGLSFQDLADAIRRFSVDLPAGAIDSEGGTYVVRTRGQAYSEREFEKIPIRTADGAEVLLGEVAEVKDGFEEGEVVVEFNDQPAMFIEVLRTGNESAIDISNKVREYVADAPTRFPEGVNLYVWDDESISIRGRLGTLTGSLFQGSILVLIVLGLFLRPSLAFWIVLGIPIAFAGGVIMMPWFGVTANVMSLFGFIIVVGIVVDDAIVTGENVYSKMKDGMPPLEAAVQGTHEVATPVTFGAVTTMVAFLPLLFFDGRWGDFAKQIPPIVAPVLLFSLVESKLILPAHLKHLRVKTTVGGYSRIQAKIADGLEGFIKKFYQPTLAFAVKNRGSVGALFIAMALAMTGYCVGGNMEFVSFPSVDRQRITASLDLPNDTPLSTTVRYVERMEAAVKQMKTEFVDPGNGKSIIQNISYEVGSARHSGGFDKSRGYVSVEVMSPDDRTEPGPRNSVLAERWTEIVGPIPEANRYRIYAESTMVRGGNDDDAESLNLELRGPSSPEKSQVAEEIRDMLEAYEGISSAWANVNYGQDELELSLKPRAAELGLTQSLLAQQIRQSFFGEEAQRVQRGVDDIRVMVRLPRKDRESLYTLNEMKIRTPGGADVPLETIADIKFTKAPSFVERNDGAEVIQIAGQPVDETVNILGIAAEITPRIEELTNANNLSYRFRGYVAEAEDAQRQTILGGLALLLALYALLSMALRSLKLSLIVMTAVPFGIIGALLGHIIMGMTPSYLSIFGMLALAGIAVNDTLIMVDFVSRRQEDGATLKEAALLAGARRFRPIMLTSVTTFLGLTPLMMDKSLQAQFLIPMAVSLAFGVIFATAITLFLVPCALLIADDITNVIGKIKGWYFRPFKSARSH
jgi:multidrug efflux pump subunit AcrB